MNSRASVLLFTALTVLLAGCASAPPPPQAHTAAAARPPAVTAAPTGPEADLQKGMPADAVQRIMGKPAEINPMPSPDGHAEVWVYHRTISALVQQVPVGTRSTDITTIGGDAMAHVAQRIEEPVFAQQIETIYETVSLLMFDGKFIERKVAVQKHVEYK